MEAYGLWHMEAYGAYPFSHPWTGERLLRRATGMHPSALGLHGWSMKDMRFMPLALLAMVADILHMVEQT